MFLSSSTDWALTIALGMWWSSGVDMAPSLSRSPREYWGSILAFDIDPDMVERARQRAEKARCWNVVSQHRDVADGYGLPEACVDGVLLFNILHGENPAQLLRQSAFLARPGGWVWVIHWQYDARTPRGPSMSIRPQPEQIAAWAESTGLLQRDEDVLDLPPWHYGWRFRRAHPSLADTA